MVLQDEVSQSVLTFPHPQHGPDQESPPCPLPTTAPSFGDQHNSPAFSLSTRLPAVEQDLSTSPLPSQRCSTPTRPHSSMESLSSSCPGLDLNRGILRTPPPPSHSHLEPPPLQRRFSSSGFSMDVPFMELAEQHSRKLDFTFTGTSSSKDTTGTANAGSGWDASWIPGPRSSTPVRLQPKTAFAQQRREAEHTRNSMGPTAFGSVNWHQAFDPKLQYPQPQPHRHTFHSTHMYQTVPESKRVFLHEEAPRRPVTSIAGSSRCLWPPDSTFLTMSSTVRDLIYNPERRASLGSDFGTLSLSKDGPLAVALGSHKVHTRTDSFKDSADCLQGLQPRRKARRVLDAPYCKERNHKVVAGHVHKLIQEAVEDGIGELDLSYLDLDDLPSEIRDLNFAIVYNERGSFSLSKNRLKLFLSSNMFSVIPMDVFAITNLSVLSLRNNSIEVIPPEIGLLHNLVELSIGGNLLKFLPSQIALLPKLQILAIHPNPFLKAPPTVAVENGPINPADGQHVEFEQPQEQEILNFPEIEGPGQSSLLSPPASPPFFTQDDVEMAEPSSAITDMNPSASSSVATQSPYSPVSQSQGSASEPSLDVDITQDRPPHEVKRSRIPSLLVLAGNTLLNALNSQDGGQLQERPRKDSKISLDGSEWLSDVDIRKDRRASASSDSSKLGYIFKEETIRLYMTPYLYEHYKRARINNRCAGCQKMFWKPCRIVIVWQDLLGQTLVPLEWKGCGLGDCVGVSRAVWMPSQSDGSSEVSPAESDTMGS